MRTYRFEASNGANWGKFCVAVMDTEWTWRSTVDDLPGSLLARRGWSRSHLWVLDLQTGEGALFLHGGYARADLGKHQIWVCPLFEPFLAWLYRQDPRDFERLSEHAVELPPAPVILYGHRRPGPTAAERARRLRHTRFPRRVVRRTGAGRAVAAQPTTGRGRFVRRQARRIAGCVPLRRPVAGRRR